MRHILLVMTVFVAVPAWAQEHPHLDLKPILAATAGVVLDTGSTMRFLSSGSGCTEATARYRQPPFTGSHPDVARMWRDDVIGLSGVIVVNWLAHLAVTRDPWSRLAKGFARTAKGYGYSAGVWRGKSGVRNIAHCGL